jgi:hypothetical protein
MAVVSRWYDRGSAELFIRRAQEAGGADGPTVGDISVSEAPVVFDGYLAEMIAKENRTLNEELRRCDWAAETLSRSAGLTPSIPPLDEHSLTPPPRTRNIKPSSQLCLVPDEVQSGLPKISPDLEHDGTVWIPRILWALEIARLNRWGPQSAADISRILRTHGNIDVPNTNVARAFRDIHRPQLWQAFGKRYEITEAGSLVIRGIIGEPNAASGLTGRAT